MAFKYILKLKSTAAPHLYVNQIKEMIKDDDELSPMLEQSLKLIKKTKMAHILLATEKELILNPELFRHFERALAPQITGYSKIDWTSSEKEKYKKDKKAFYAEMLRIYEKLGYEISDAKEVTEDEIKWLDRATTSEGKR